MEDADAKELSNMLPLLAIQTSQQLAFLLGLEQLFV
jgi:hypothetical protein